MAKTKITGVGKFDYDTHNVMESISHPEKSHIVDMVFNGVPAVDPLAPTMCKVSFANIPVECITPRSVNQYKQNRIDRLARSIRNTNNRLIHPIVVVHAKDLPQDGEVIRRFRERGVDVSRLQYVIVAGERRFRAWMKLREEEEKNPTRPYYEENPFNTITANVLTHEEALNENAFFEDSNIETRQLTPLEGILHIRDALSEVDTDEKKREALIEMNGGSAEGISDDAYKAAKKFNQAKYCEYYLSAELGLEGWSRSTIKTYLSVVNNCPEEIIDAILSGEFSAGAARILPSLSHDEQREALRIYKEQGAPSYNAFVNGLIEKQKAPKKVVRFNHKDAQKEIRNAIKKIKKEKENIESIAKLLGTNDKATTQKAITKMGGLIADLEKIVVELN